MFGDEVLDGVIGRMRNSVCHLKFHLKKFTVKVSEEG